VQSESAPHHSAMLGADIPNAEVIGHNRETALGLFRLPQKRSRGGQHSQTACKQLASFHSFPL
jgi:hypothetical protein